MSQDSLFRVPPSKSELDIIHDFFIRTVDHNAMSFKVTRKLYSKDVLISI